MEAKNIYDLKLGQHFVPNNNEDWFRVPGGWIYSNLGGTVFIPFDNEFMSKSKDNDIWEGIG